MKSLIKTAIFLLFFVPAFLFAQSDFENWSKSQINGFDDYKKSLDKEFSDYLKKDWESFKLEKGADLYKKPKPVKLPSLPEKQPVTDPNLLPPEKISTPKISTPKISTPKIAVPQKPIEPYPEPISPEIKQCNEKKIDFDFYGTPITVCCPQKLRDVRLQSVSNQGIADFWEDISQTDCKGLLTIVDEYQNSLKLNDWGRHLLVYNIGMQIFNNNEQMARLFIWFMGVKSGFNIKVGYNEENIYPLFAYDDTIYAARYFYIQGQKFYILFADSNKDTLSLKTYKDDYPDAKTKIDLNIASLPVLKTQKTTRDINFDYKGKNYSIQTHYDINSAKYFEKYPQTQFEIYFKANLAYDLKDDLLGPIGRLIEGMDTLESVRAVLRLTQKGFDYKTDNLQFGKEKYLLPNETLYYPFSDCEDRSIFFAFAVKNLIGADVIALHYPGHIATAVDLGDSTKGSYVLYKGKKYTICDPTYINADIGMAMPQFASVTPEIIVF